MIKYLNHSQKEPYRLFFPLGVLFLLWGALVWLPLIWSSDGYPVTLHRYLMLNGFSGCFIGGFLMTAIPKFSRTQTASKVEITAYLLVTISGLFFARSEITNAVFICSALQPLVIFSFLLPRISKRQENPPYSFVFIFVGLMLWTVSALASLFLDSELFKHIHYEGAIASIILGVGSRLIPGILGHQDIVAAQKEKYEQPVSIIKTIPVPFLALIFSFVASYFSDDLWAHVVRAAVVFIIAIFYWKLGKAPKTKTALTWCLWISSWLITLSFVIKAFWTDGLIHISHSFFINGIVLLSLLIATRVLQSHGPKDNKLEQSKILYWVSFFIVLAAATRVSAFLLPDLYLTHLAYSSLMLAIGVLLWSFKYLRYVLICNT
jgi:uncharacterized protein involved in response to NO